MGNKTFFPISSGLLTAKHIEPIGQAIWLFLWLIDKTTAEEVRDGCRWGLVLYGKPVSSTDIAAQLGISARSCRRYLETLEDKGYISIGRCNDGHIIRVRKSVKWEWRETLARDRANLRPGHSQDIRKSAAPKPGGIDWEAEAKRGL